MATSSTTFKKGNTYNRGKSERTKILDALKRKSKDEDQFYDLLVTQALDDKDMFAFKELFARLSPIRKAVMPDVEFEFEVSATPSEQVSQILDAISQGLVPPDVGATLIQSVKNAVDIQVNTDLKERIENLEKVLNA